MNTRKLTIDARHALHTLWQTAETDLPAIDPDDLEIGNPTATLEALYTRQLAKPTTEGLWRITLGGLAYARNRWAKHLNTEAA